MQIPFGNLQRQYQQLHESLDAAIRAVCERGWFILGQEVEQFEEAFARFCGAPHAVGVGSGTEALHLALLAVGVQPGDEVITVANTCVPTISAISFAGAIPIFVDIDERTFTMSPARIAERLTSRTKAILPVHLYGQCAEMGPILEIAKAHGVAVVEDCAQAQGASYHGQMAGTMGDVGAFSFYPSKNLGAFGDAGLIVTQHAEIAQAARKLRNYGEEQRYYHSTKGFNSRLDELQAAILRAKLPHLPVWNLRRRQIAQQYSAAFARLGMICPSEALHRVHTYHLYVVRVRQRAQFQQRLKTRGIVTLIHYPVPVHQQQAYAECRDQGGYLPVTERIAGEIVSLPLYPELYDDELDYILQNVADVYESLYAEDGIRISDASNR